MYDGNYTDILQTIKHATLDTPSFFFTQILNKKYIISSIFNV